MPLFILIILGLMLALDLIWWGCADRAVRRFPRARIWRAGIALFMTLQLLTLAWLFAGRSFGVRPERMLPAWSVVALFLWHFLLVPVGTLVWAAMGGWRLFQRVGRQRGNEATGSDSSSPQVPMQPVPPTRRQFLTRAVAAAAPPLITGIGSGLAMTQLDEFRIRRLTIPLAALPPALDGLTIAHVTDIHVGSFTRGRVLDRIVTATNDLRADLVLLTGDLINNALADLPAALDVVKRMDARHGVYMCEGNHDLIEDRYAFERRTKDSGVPLLINESMTARIRGESVQLLGLRWGSASPAATRAQSRSDEAIASSFSVVQPLIRPGAFPILLAHHPHAFDYAAAANVPLTLAGHTHGGQLMLTKRIGFGPMMFRYWSGLYQRGDNDSALVVSNGVGNWFPLRTHAPAEIIHITLKRPANA